MKAYGWKYKIDGNILRYWKGCACNANKKQLMSETPQGRKIEAEEFLINL